MHKLLQQLLSLIYHKKISNTNILKGIIIQDISKLVLFMALINSISKSNNFYLQLLSIQIDQSMSRINNSKIAIARQQSGIVFRVSHLTDIGSIPEKVYIEIRNETNLNTNQRSSIAQSSTKKTRTVAKRDSKWDEDFFYNNEQMLDDNITFILRSELGAEIARNQVRNLSLRDFERNKAQTVSKSIPLKNEEDTLANLVIEISFFEREDIIGGVVMPKLSLAPPAGFKGRYNAVQFYKPAFSDSNKGMKANCFNFYDSDVVPGFNSIEVFPSKYKTYNFAQDQKVEDKQIKRSEQ